MQFHQTHISYFYISLYRWWFFFLIPWGDLLFSNPQQIMLVSSIGSEEWKKDHTRLAKSANIYTHTHDNTTKKNRRKRSVTIRRLSTRVSSPWRVRSSGMPRGHEDALIPKRFHAIHFAETATEREKATHSDK